MSKETPAQVFESYLKHPDPFVVLRVDPQKLAGKSSAAKSIFVFSNYEVAKLELDSLFTDRNPERLSLLQRALFKLLKSFK
jgi:hypothetical protein